MPIQIGFRVETDFDILGNIAGVKVVHAKTKNINIIIPLNISLGSLFEIMFLRHFAFCFRIIIVSWIPLFKQLH